MPAAVWTDLLDPSEEELREHAPPSLPPAVLRALARPSTGEAEPRPRLVGLGEQVFGILLVPVVVHDEPPRVYYQEVDLLLTKDAVLTVRKTPPGGQAFDLESTRAAVIENDPAGVIAYRIADEVAEAYLDLIDTLDDEIDELEDHVEEWPAERVRQRISHTRHDLLHIRRTLSPTRDAIREVVDNRVEVAHGEVFGRRLELLFGTVYDKLLRASEGLDFARDLLAGVRDYVQAKISQDQNEAMKRLTAIASILLVPTFIVGVYGQNFKHIPELGWSFGYAWSWGWIVLVTIAQWVYFKRRGWL